MYIKFCSDLSSGFEIIQVSKTHLL